MNLNLEKEHVTNFELVLQVRDNLGKPTGKTKRFHASSGNELSYLFNKHCTFEYVGEGSYKVRGKKRGRK